MNILRKTNEKEKLVFKIVIYFIFNIFRFIYIASISGYYEAQVSDKVALTNDAIKDFEQDVLEGKEVDINTYIKEENKDYSNKMTDLGDKFTESVQTFLTNGFGGIWDALKVLFF